MTEIEIIQGCQKGKSKHQKALYDQYAGLVMHLCMRYSNNREDAEDLFQECFIRIFTYIKNFQENNSFNGWLHKVCINVIINKYRSSIVSKRNGQNVELEDEIIEHSINVDFPSIPSEVLYQFIQELSPGYRTIFSLFEIEGYSHDEIAEMLGCSSNNSRSQLSRAKRILQEKIEKFLSNEEMRLHKQKIKEEK